MQTVVGLFDTKGDAERAIGRLQTAGFRADTIGVAMRDATASGDLADATGAEDMSEEGATAGAISGAGIGALVGLALVGSNLVLPGLGTFVIAGPLAAALAGAGLGAASGGLVGGLIGAGIPEHEAGEYAEHVQGGGILVSVQATSAQTAVAREILADEGAVRTSLPSGTNV